MLGTFKDYAEMIIQVHTADPLDVPMPIQRATT